MTKVLVLGGYGNAGSQIVDLLLAGSDSSVVVAGRSVERGQQFVAARAGQQGSDRLSSMVLDAYDDAAARAALADVDLCVVAAGRGPLAGHVARACIETRTHYLDLQIGAAKVTDLRSLDTRARAAGVCLVTDGGFHPGVPGAMVRHVAARVPELAAAHVSSVIDMDWSAAQPLARSTVDEMLDEFTDFAYEEYAGGVWRTARRSRKVRFPEPFGVRPCAAMGLAEMREASWQLPRLRDGGFYVGGFNPVVDRLVIPVVWLGMRFAPNRTRNPLGELLARSLMKYAKPPYGTILQLEGGAAGERPRTLMRLSHPDAYTLTAAPAAAAALQIVDGSRPAGVHLQAMVVDTDRFFADMERFGILVELMV